MSTACRGQAGSVGRGAGEGIASLVWSQNLSRESMLFFICPLKSGDTAGRGRVQRGTRVIIDQSAIRHSGRSDMSARNKDKNPSPVEHQFYDFKDKQPKL